MFCRDSLDQSYIKRQRQVRIVVEEIVVLKEIMTPLTSGPIHDFSLGELSFL